MENSINRSTVRKKIVCQNFAPSFGFSDVSSLSAEARYTHKRLILHGSPLTTNESTSRKIAKICSSQDDLQVTVRSPKKIIAEQRTSRRQRAKSADALKKTEAEKRKENLKELHEKSKLLLQKNLKRKIKKSHVPPPENVVHNIKTPTNTPRNNSPVYVHSPKPDKLSKPSQDGEDKIENNVNAETEETSKSQIVIEISDEIMTKPQLSENKAATIIQKYYRKYKAKKNDSKSKDTSHKTGKTENKSIEISNSTISENLYLQYPYNIISTVKSKCLTVSDDVDINVDKTNSPSDDNVNKISNFDTVMSDKPTADKLLTTNVSIHIGTSTPDHKSESSKKNFSVISSLKSSLDEIQNLTSSFSFGSFVQEPISNKKFPSSIRNNLVSFSETFNSATSKENENILNIPEVNLLWLRRNNKNSLSPRDLQNSFQDELNLLESFNNSLRQVQHIEKSLTTIRRDDLSATDIDNNFNDTKEDATTDITILGNSDNMSNISHNPIDLRKNKNDNLRKTNNVQISNLRKTYQLNTEQYCFQKCFESDKSLILSQKEKYYNKEDFSDNSDAFLSDKDSIVEKNIDSYPSSINYNQKHLLNFKDYKNSDMTNRLNKFCLCLVNQYIEDERVRSEYLNTLLKVREKTLLDATRNELLCLEMQKKQNQSQIPLLKKKQRGLLLKLQQERNEIKHIKKFQLGQSQERKASLRRQLKHLKQMLACDEVLVNLKTKTKNSNNVLNSSINSATSPLKGINITLGNDVQNSNNSLSKIWESLEKRRQDLDEQKKKMRQILDLHFANMYDMTEIKVIQDKLSKLPLGVEHKENENNLESKQILESVPESDKNFSSEEVNFNKEYVEFDENRCKCMIGSTLNTLWEKVTGEKCDKFDNNKHYNMSKASLDVFFNDAKQVAIRNMLSTLQHNSKPEPVLQSLAMNKIETPSFLNNLLKSEGRELADLISRDKVTQQEMLNKNENSCLKSNTNVFIENVNDGSEPSDTSKSTAHSLVEELSYLYPNTENFVDPGNESLRESNKDSKTANSQINAISQSPDSRIANKDNNKIINLSNRNINIEKYNKNLEVFNNKTSVIESTNNMKNLYSSIQDTSKALNLANTRNQKTKKNIVSDKNTNVNIENCNTKSDLFIDHHHDLANKRYYAEERNISRLLDNKSPINTDHFSGSWESVTPSPDPSPRDSPTGEYSPAAASLPLCHISEAEELRRKQLAIELEIKALEQQQTQQLPFCLVREIPDKPPPPYIPPSEEVKVIVSPVKVVETKTPPSIPSLIEAFCKWLWKKFTNGLLEMATYNEYSNDKKFSMNFQEYGLVFDVCFETFEYEYAQLPSKEYVPALPWEYDKYANNNNKDINEEEICNRVKGRVKEMMGIEVEPIRENLIISWTQKRQDFLNNLLIKELHKEEADWLNFEPFEVDLKNSLVDSILDSLLVEICNELKVIMT